MSSSLVKGRLKASREAIQAKDWEKAEDEATEVLKYEAENYNAQVFRGLALLHLKRYDESEEAYRTAIKSHPSQLLAWQGLEKFYSETKAWDKLAGVLQSLMDLALEADDESKCAEALQRMVVLQREEGTRLQVATALSFYLPLSRYHALLSKLPNPDQTNPNATTTFAAEMAIHVESIKVIEEVISMTEESESILVDREVEKRRTRLETASKSRDVLRNEVGVEIWRHSKLPELYDQVLSHVNASDEMRREAEHKLLLYRHRFLQALPNPASKIAGPASTAAKEDTCDQEKAQLQEKDEALQVYTSLASGIVAINVPDELAWVSTLEWENVFSPIQLPLHQLRAFIDHFPRSGLSLSFKALLYTIRDEQFLKEERERIEAQDVEVPSPDPLLLAIEGVEEARQSALAHRIAASLYLLDRDWVSCSDVATSGLELAKRLEIKFAIDLKMVKAGLESNLASALTHLHPPQHHARALRLSDSVLSKEPDAIDAILCKAHIAEAAGRWDQAKSLFSGAKAVQSKNLTSETATYIQKLSISQNPEREARLEMAWCDVKMGRLEQGKEQLEDVIKDLDTSKEVNSEDQAKAWWRLGTCLWEMGGQFREETSQAFTCFITALKRDASYAPAFTSLGFYYSTVSQPTDLNRAAKCFQKAFELDPREDEAARCLAQTYAEENDWDLVYLVAQRTIEGEGGALALSGEVSSQRRHITRNAWAWTAIGSTELFRGNFEKAIVAFQIALRSFPEDGSIWMRLGEAYTASGRLDAAIKTFGKALVIMKDTKEQWQPEYSIASVQRQQGKYKEALEILVQLCTQETEDLGIKVACAETRLCLALQESREGYAMRAKENIVKSMTEAIQILEVGNHMLGGWKLIADGLFHYSTLHLEDHDEVVGTLTGAVDRLTKVYNVDTGLPSISAITLEKVIQTERSKSKALLLCVYVNKLRVLLHHKDEQVAGSAWMDLSIGLHQVSITQDDVSSEDYQSQAIACAKEALKMEPGNGKYWNSLGELVFNQSVKLAQHCFIKAIESDARDAMPWTSLGFLYLQNDDVTLAKECFTKAQTLDSEYVQAWIGHAMVVKKVGSQTTSSRALFQHAYAINEGNELEASYGFATSLFKALSDSNSNEGLIPLSQIRGASFALSSYLTQRPSDVSALHLSALFAERLGELETAIERIQMASTILEGQYEQDESIEKAHLFAVCMVNLGRIRTENGDYEGAKDAFEMSLGLLVAEGEEEEEDSSNLKTRSSLHLTLSDLKRARMGANCGSGIAQFALGEETEAISALRVALEDDLELDDTISRVEIQILLAQMLWTIGEVEEAESVVMEAISLCPKHVSSLLTLGSICVLNDDQEQLNLVKGEMQEMINIDKTMQICNFISILHLEKGEFEEAIKTLQPRVGNSIASRLALTRLLLQVAIHSSLEGKAQEKAVERRQKEEEVEDVQEEEGPILRASQESYRLLNLVQSKLSEVGQDHLISTYRCTAIALALQGKKEEAERMAQRVITLEPFQISHLTLLHAIQCNGIVVANEK